MKLTLACLVVLATMAPAAANQNLNANIPVMLMVQPNVPIQITGCSAIANDYVSNRVSPPSYLYTQVQTLFAFKNTGQSDATAIKFGFEIDDSFNKPYGTFGGTLRGTFAPGVLIEPHRQGILNVLQSDAAAWTANVNEQDVGRVICFVQSVLFADGTVWNR